MTTSQAVKSIQDTFDINMIYAKRVFGLVPTGKNLLEVAAKIIEEKPKPFVKWVGGKRQLLKQFLRMHLYSHYYLIKKTVVLNWYTFA